MRFASPLLLCLLALVPVLLALWARDERRRAARLALLMDGGQLAGLARGVSPARRAWRRGLALAALALLVIAAAGPQLGDRVELLPHRGLDVLFVVDVSRSMRTRDVSPDRLERAKAEIAAMLPRLVEHRVGLVAFAGSAFVQCPLTTDMEAVRLFLSHLGPGSVPQGGTALAAGLEVAANALIADAEGRGPAPALAGRVVVVVTDGEDHEGNVEAVAETLKRERVTVMLIGVGSTVGEPIPVLDDNGSMAGYLLDGARKPVLSQMNPAVLADVAARVGGTFIDGTAQHDLGLGAVEAKVAGLEKRDLESRTQRHYVDRTWIPLLIALMLTFLAVAIPERSGPVEAS